MSYNPVIKGLNATWKLITKGYGKITSTGTNVRICKIWTDKYLCMKVNSDLFINHKLSTKDFIDMKVGTL